MLILPDNAGPFIAESRKKSRTITRRVSITIKNIKDKHHYIPDALDKQEIQQLYVVLILRR